MLRKLGLALGAGAVTISTLGFGAAPASSAECVKDGSVPGGGPAVYTVGSGNGTTFYVDDRDFADADEDGAAGGIWLYQEANSTAGLQRGGAQFVEAMIPGSAPKINPTPVGPFTLFPNGFGGTSWSETLGGKDPCNESATPDRIWF